MPRAFLELEVAQCAAAQWGTLWVEWELVHLLEAC